MANKHIIHQDGSLGSNQMEIEPNYRGRLFGPELEYFTVREKNGILVPADLTDAFKKSPLFEMPGKDNPGGEKIKIKPEITNEQIELDAPPENSIATIETNLNNLLGEALNIAADNGARLLPTALYPLDSKFTTFPLERYHMLIDRLGPHMAKNAPRVASDQINVGGIDEKDAFETFNFLRTTLPFLVGFGAASPFVNGKKGEDLSERIRVYNQSLQRFPELAGFPPKLNSLEEYVSAIQGAPIIQHPNIYYKHMRPMPQRGVAGEIRVLDKQPTVKEYLAFVALTKGLVNNREKFKAPKFLLRDFYRAVQDGIYDRKEFEEVLQVARDGLSADEAAYLAPLARRIEKGTVAEKLVSLVEKDGAPISEAYKTLCDAVESGEPYI
jgi:gamma-glutamyl:cysteine ligase YbdK (ATP-grasp superfamily)